jgi:glutathione S-transferase
MYVCIHTYIGKGSVPLLVDQKKYFFKKIGRGSVPLLVDPNTDAIVHEAEIVPYLWETYGPLLGELLS